MLWHVTYRDRSGSTQVGRVSAATRSAALSEAALRFNVRRTAVTSAVKLPKPLLPAKGQRADTALAPSSNDQ